MSDSGRRPSVDIDPFSDAFLEDPHPHHETIREAGPAVWLAPIGAWGMGRHEHVAAALRDWETFCSSAGVGLADFTRETPWRPPSIILEADPPLHTKSRRVLAPLLTARALEGLRENFSRQARALVTELAERETFDAVADLAESYPLAVFPDAVGLPQVGRSHLLPYGDMVFNAFGPANVRRESALAAAAPVRAAIAEFCSRGALAPGGFGAAIYAAADREEITEAEAGLLVRSLLSAGLDTTVIGLGTALHICATEAGVWQRLRSQPQLARALFDETLRFDAPIQTFFRTTTRDVSVDTVRIPAGDKVVLFLGAANRDPRKWQTPGTFDIDRKTMGHVAYGAGIHACVGQNLARLEAEVLLQELARNIGSIELAGTPERRLNNTLRGWARLPVRVLR